MYEFRNEQDLKDHHNTDGTHEFIPYISASLSPCVQRITESMLGGLTAAPDTTTPRR